MRMRASKWRPFSGNYRKQCYEVKLSDGTILKNGWPNAGRMHVGGKEYSPSDGIYVRPRCRPSVPVNEGGLLDHVGCVGPTKEQADAKGSPVCDRSRAAAGTARWWR